MYSEICVVTRVKTIYEKMEDSDKYREIEILWRGQLKWAKRLIQARLIRVSTGLEARWRPHLTDWSDSESTKWKTAGPKLERAIKLAALSKKMRI